MKNIKNILYKWLFAIIFAITLISAGSGVALAHGHGGGGGGWHGGGGGWHGGGGGWHGGGWHGHGGGWNGGGWNNGGWGGWGLNIGFAPGYYGYYNDYPYVHCVIVRGHHDYYGYWIPTHRQCWY
jgi:hypothetical protein